MSPRLEGISLSMTSLGGVRVGQGSQQKQAKEQSLVSLASSSETKQKRSSIGQNLFWSAPELEGL